MTDLTPETQKALAALPPGKRARVEERLAELRDERLIQDAFVAELAPRRCVWRISRGLRRTRACRLASGCAVAVSRPIDEQPRIEDEHWKQVDTATWVYSTRFVLHSPRAGLKRST